MLTSSFVLVGLWSAAAAGNGNSSSSSSRNRYQSTDSSLQCSVECVQLQYLANLGSELWTTVSTVVQSAGWTIWSDNGKYGDYNHNRYNSNNSYWVHRNYAIDKTINRSVSHTLTRECKQLHPLCSQC